MKKLILIAVLAIGTWKAEAQLKIGYISSSALVESMPEAKKAQSEVEAIAKTYREQLEKMQKELETKYKAYEAEVKKGMSDALRDVKEKELQSLQNNIMTTQQSAEEKVANKREELLAPITLKADKAMKEVAKEKGYTYVFDSDNSGLVYAPDGDNILSLVRAKLGIKETPPPAGGTAPKTK